MSHSPQCMEVHGSIDTIVLPRRGEQIAVPSGTDVDVFVALREGFALWVTFPSAVTIELIYDGNDKGNAKNDVVTCSPGTRRIVSPENYVALAITCTSAGRVWIEDLHVLEPRRGGVRD